MTEGASFRVDLERIREFEFRADFDWQGVAPLVVDEPEPLGDRKGPNASRLLGTAVGNCLSASLLFCLEKAKVEVNALKTAVTGHIVRNERGRLRVGKIEVHIMVDAPSDTPQRVSRCLELFEDYCVVTASVRKGIDVNVVVTNREGQQLFPAV